MGELIKTPEIKNFSLNEIALSEVVEEMLSERGKDKILDAVFFWNAVHLYRERMGFKGLNEDEIIELKRQITPSLIKIFKEKHRAFSAEDDVTKVRPACKSLPPVDAPVRDEPISRYMEAERRLEDLNEGKRLAI